jgi:hypothetical protein
MPIEGNPIAAVEATSVAMRDAVLPYDKTGSIIFTTQDIGAHVAEGHRPKSPNHRRFFELVGSDKCHSRKTSWAQNKELDLLFSRSIKMRSHELTTLTDASRTVRAMLQSPKFFAYFLPNKRDRTAPDSPGQAMKKCR